MSALGASLLAALAPAGAALGPAPAQDLAQLELQLQSEDPLARRAAVIALAQEGSSAAWLWVLQALGEREAMVADEAQLRLGTCRDPLSVRRLLSNEGLSSREPRRRARAAEAAGRLAVPVEPRQLLAGLKVDNAEVQRMTLWSVERLARSGLLGQKGRRQLDTELEFLRTRAREPGLRAAACAASAWARPERAAALAAAALEDPEPLVRAAGVWLLGELDAPGAEESAWPLRRDRSPAVRAALDRLLARLGRASAVAKLVTRLESEERGGLRARIAGHLQRLSGRRHGPDPAPWRAWADELPRNWRPVREPRRPTAPQSAPRLAGLPLTSDRFTLLIDLSDSMWAPLPNGETRRDRAGHELRLALAELDAGTRFNLAPYAAQAAFWQDQLQEASRRNAERALAHYRHCQLRGPGNLWRAFLQAIGDPAIDAVVLYTSGTPSGTGHWNLDLIALLLAERNRFRNVQVDAVLVEPNRKLAARWRAICESTGGRTVVVTD